MDNVENMVVIETFPIGEGSYTEERIVIKRLSDNQYRTDRDWTNKGEPNWQTDSFWTPDKYLASSFDTEEEAVEFARRLGYEVEGYPEDDIDTTFPGWMTKDSMAEALARHNSSDNFPIK